MCLFLVLALCASPPATESPDPVPSNVDGHSEEAEPPEEEEEEDGRSPFVGTPTFDYNSDRGIGLGAVGTLYDFDPELLPYKRSLFLKAYISSRLVQDHEIRYDHLQLVGLPIRLNARAGFLATVTYSYCGVGNQTECDDGRARAALEAASESVDDEALRHYYHMRFLRPYGDLFVRTMLNDKPHRRELFVGFRGNYVFPGNFSERTPYPVSLFAEQFPKGQKGWVTQLLVGFTQDDRDREAAPRRGYYVEGGMRLAVPALGSRWQWFGVFGSGSYFVPLTERLGSWVLATRLLGDASWGDVPILEMGRTTGLVESPRFGGHAIGRGVRQGRFLGKLNLIAQAELRASLVTFEVWEQQIEAGGALLFDAGWIGYQANDLRDDPWTIPWGTGVAFRFMVNDNFVVRFDSGISPAEDFRPRFYVKVGNPF